MLRKFKTAIMLANLVTTSSLLAFDDKKEGFINSLGLGLTNTQSDFKKAYDEWSVGKESKVGLASSSKIGYGFTEQFSLYLVQNTSFVFDDSKDNGYKNGIIGVGMNYYLTPQSHTYLMAAAGLGLFSELSTDSPTSDGKAFLVGVGYEIYPHIHAEATYVATRINDNAKVNTNAFQVILNYYWY